MEIQIQVSKTDWEGILRTMEQYGRLNGYVAFVGGKFTYFDAEPSCGGALVTKSEVKQYISEY